MTKITVKLDKRSYPVLVGPGIVNELPKLLKKNLSERRIFVLYDARFYALHGKRVSSVIKKAGRPIELVVPSGEKAKSLRQLGQIYSFLLDQKISRADFILACGGGVTADLAGFAAATVLRGVKWGIVSTTLLSMVDAAIGGKTALNLPQGKNLIGAFWQPAFVVNDIDQLMTLPQGEIISGLGEVVKYAGLVGPSIMHRLQVYLNGGDFYDRAYLEKLVALSVRYKAGVVSADERDSGTRMFLNLGHTFSHAVESNVRSRGLSHGESLLIGLSAACHLSESVYPRGRSELDTYRAMVERLLRYVPRRSIDPQKVMQTMTVDKKRSGERLKFILLQRPGKPIIVENVNRRLIVDALKKALNRYHEIGGRHAHSPGGKRA